MDFNTEKTINCTYCKKEQTWTELDEKESIQECPSCGYRNLVIADDAKK